MHLSSRLDNHPEIAPSFVSEMLDRIQAPSHAAELCQTPTVIGSIAHIHTFSHIHTYIHTYIHTIQVGCCSVLKVALCNRSQTDATVEIVQSDGIFWCARKSTRLCVCVCVCVCVKIFVCVYS